MPDINAAYQWAIDTCNASNPWAGYSMTDREQVQIGNIVYYDCSSFIWYALVQGGGFILPTPPFATPDMLSVLTAAGFQIIVPTSTTTSLAGDILWYDHGGGPDGHTEMVFAGGVGQARTMGAHSANRPIADQVSIGANYVSYSDRQWQYLARWGNGVEYNWHNKNYGAYARNSLEAQENVMKIVTVLAGKGWTINAIAGMIGNIEAESGLNPWRWQNDTLNLSNGYGLFQYTPATKYINSSLAQSFAEFAPNNPIGSGGQDDGTAQLLFMCEDITTDGHQWIPTSGYPMTFTEYQHSTLPPDYLASAWLYDFERAGVLVEAQRRANAIYWYDWITAHPWISSGRHYIIPCRRVQKHHRKRRLGY